MGPGLQTGRPGPQALEGLQQPGGCNLDGGDEAGEDEGFDGTDDHIQCNSPVGAEKRNRRPKPPVHKTL